MAEVVLVGDVTPEMVGEELGLEGGPVVILKCTRDEARLFGPLLYQELAIGGLYAPANPEQAGGPTTAFAGLMLKPRKHEGT